MQTFVHISRGSCLLLMWCSDFKICQIDYFQQVFVKIFIPSIEQCSKAFHSSQINLFVFWEQKQKIVYSRPPYFSLQSSEMLILPYAISIFLLNRIIIKFGNKARRRREKHSAMSRVFPYTSFALLLLPACFTTEQNIFKASLFVLDNFTFT